MAIAWRRLTRTFPVGDRTVAISIEAISQADGAAIVEIHWLPRRPERLSLDDIAQFDRGFKQARAELLAALEDERARHQ
jgi:hypothetical protein